MKALYVFAPVIAAMAAVAIPTAPSHHPRPDIEALSQLVGEWQTDTVGGVSARSSCAWTAWRLAVLCEQRIDGLPGAPTALNFFTADAAGTGFALYVLSRSGSVITPIAIVMNGAEWRYGGSSQASDGRWYRTVNDFRNPDSYTWRQETSLDGKQWTAGPHGRSRRIR